MLNKTIDSALLNLRRQMCRAGQDLAQVNALLAQRGIDSGALPATYRSGAQAKRGETKRAVIAALADGPKRGADVARHMCQREPGLSYPTATVRVHPALARMAASGLVVRDGDRWRLSTDSHITRQSVHQR